mmetsp:Transcript_65787/g.183254  ORF Transcript_65787/g.183254 Transcript_65787/m.183254 type:complete len:206 (+) Transcript_65787:548-1165(+)
MSPFRREKSVADECEMDLNPSWSLIPQYATPNTAYAKYTGANPALKRRHLGIPRRSVASMTCQRSKNDKYGTKVKYESAQAQPRRISRTRTLARSGGNTQWSTVRIWTTPPIAPRIGALIPTCSSEGTGKRSDAFSLRELKGLEMRFQAMSASCGLDQKRRRLHSLGTLRAEQQVAQDMLATSKIEAMAKPNMAASNANIQLGGP